MTSKTTTKTASPKTGKKSSEQQSRTKHSRRHSVKKANRINRQRRLQKQLQILLLERHSRRCIICHHPEREAIEEEFVHWRAPWKLSQDYKLADYRTVYRHARAVGLLLQRRERLHSALDAFVESVDDVTFTGDTILRAMRAYSCIDDHGRWTEIPTQVQFSTNHDTPPPQPTSHRSSVAQSVRSNVTSSLASDILDIIPKHSNHASRSNATTCAAPPAQAFNARDLDDDDSDPDDDSDDDDPKNKSEVDSPKETNACAVSPAQALPRDVLRGQNPNYRSPSDRSDCASVPAQPAAPLKPKPDADGIIWHPRPGYPNQEISEPNAEGLVMYKIHMTTAAPQLPSRKTDAQRAAELIYRSVIKKYGNP